MLSNPARLWRKFSQWGGLLLASILLTVVVFHQLRTLSRLPSSAAGSSATASLHQSTVAVSSPVVGQSDLYQQGFSRQVAQLRRLYQSAPKLSVEALMDREAAEADSYASKMFASLDPPTQYRIDADPTNFGDRFEQDVNEKPLQNKLLVVLHETASAASSAVNAVLTPHPRDEDQISYHAVIRLNGEILYLVDPDKRAYGAGNSAFKGASGVETVQTNKNLKSSVNNFAYHISLETPADGYHQHPEHSGYSAAQYMALAWLIARSGVSDDRITTHEAVDRSGERQDPRRFDMAWLQKDLALNRTEVFLGGANLP
ncbi:MAG: peptidoglycan recognition protein family protein [Thermosynechococcaceae cyanobacterium MS004]|nr:peptidoglycan recognition protein family protein [Thermosynechococcaceae cyanobacterium MS004]